MADTTVDPGAGPIAVTGSVPAVLATANNSGVAGFIAPVTAPLYDNPLDDFFHSFLAALSTLPGELVRPRWQPEPPNMPAFTTDWLAWGITELEEDPFAYQDQVGGEFQVQRDEILTMLISHYGPRAGQLAKQISASIQLSQNRAYLRSQSLTVIEVGQQIRIPALVKEMWVPRVDQRIRFRRRATWAYQINNVESVQAGLDNELYITDITVNP